MGSALRVVARPCRYLSDPEHLQRICICPSLFLNPGSHLLSRTVSSKVPSAARALTIVFGMGTGVAPGRIAARKSVPCCSDAASRLLQHSSITEQ